MNKVLIIIGITFFINTVSASDYPKWTFPILSSKHIKDECSMETNRVEAKLTFSRTGEIEKFTFLSKSSIQAINKEAKNNISSASPYSEFQNMTEKEKIDHRIVIVQYTIPCKSHNQQLLRDSSLASSFASAKQKR